MNRQGAGFFPGEVAGNNAAPVSYPGEGNRGNQQFIIQEYGDALVVLAYDALRQVGENPGAAVVEGDVNRPFSGILVGGCVGVGQVVAGESEFGIFNGWQAGSRGGIDIAASALLEYQ